MRFLLPILTCAVLVAAASCGGGESDGDATSTVTVSAAAAAEAASYFKQTCVPCHGEVGKGDGPAGASLDPKPADLTSAEWQAGVTDQHIHDIIVSGGAAVGKSPIMPPNPVLKSKDEVVWGLVQFVRALEGK